MEGKREIAEITKIVGDARDAGDVESVENMGNIENIENIENIGNIENMAEVGTETYGGRNLRYLLKERLRQRLKESRVWRFVYSVAALLAAVAVGTLPLLLLMAVVLGWYFMPQEAESLLQLIFSPLSDSVGGTVDLSWVTLAALLVSPFCAGYTNGRWQGWPMQRAGAASAFLLWMMGMAAYWWVFGEFTGEKAVFVLLIAVLSGIGGALTAGRKSGREQGTK